MSNQGLRDALNELIEEMQEDPWVHVANRLMDLLTAHPLRPLPTGGGDRGAAVEPCPVCDSQGACAYDAEGRALIHTDTELPEDPQ